MTAPKNMNEVCYGNIFYFWRLETKIIFAPFLHKMYISYSSTYFESVIKAVLVKLVL